MEGPLGGCEEEEEAEPGKVDDDERFDAPNKGVVIPALCGNTALAGDEEAEE